MVYLHWANLRSLASIIFELLSKCCQLKNMKSIKFCFKGFTLQKLLKWEFFKSKFLKTFQIIQNYFPTSENHQNGPKLSESRKIDDIQKILENPENYPE